jgi:hypothetical protein
MFSKTRIRWRALTSAVLAVLLPFHLLPARLIGQGDSSTAVEYTTPDEYQVTRPMACPLQLTGGFLGFFFGYEHAGHEWTDQWQRDRVLDPVNHSLAEYVPAGDPLYIVSRDDRARWYSPRLTVRCTVTEWWSRGRIVRARDSYKVIGHGGNVVECGSGGGGTSRELAEHTDPYASSYDPYAAADYSGGGGTCSGMEDSTDSGGTGGTSTGSGTPYQPGDYTGGETVDWGTGEGNGGTSVCGDKAMVEYVCIEIYNEETGFWEEWGCGYVTTC